jgi:hypothetical protein
MIEPTMAKVVRRPPHVLLVTSYATEIEREVAQQWPQSSVHKVDAGHVMFLDKPEVAVEAVKRVASK